MPEVGIEMRVIGAADISVGEISEASGVLNPVNAEQICASALRAIVIERARRAFVNRGIAARCVSFFSISTRSNGISLARFASRRKHLYIFRVCVLSARVGAGEPV